MTCNIDARGQRARRQTGIVSIVLGAGVAGAAVFFAVWWLWIVAAGAVAGGAFALFEAQKKWCALRAMGVKTRV